MKKIIILFIILLLIPYANAGTLEAYTEINHYYDFNLSYFKNLSHQIIVNIPKEEFENTKNIDKIKFICGRKSTTTGNLVVRLYKYTTIPNYIYLDSYGIAPNQCLDFGYQIGLSIYPEIEVEDNMNYAVGFYDISTSGNWYIFGSNANHKWLFPVSKTETVNDVNGNSINYYDDYYKENLNINFIPISVYGQHKWPVTPQPTPTSVGNETNASIPCTFCDVPFPESTTNESFEPDFSNPNEICPDCFNDTKIIIPEGNLDNEKGATKTLKSFGYCNEFGCSIQDLINFLYDFSLLLFFISLLTLAYKLW